MPLTRRGRRVVTILVVAAVVLVGVVAVRRSPLGGWLGFGGGPPCTLQTGVDEVRWTAVQAMTATTVAGVGTRIGATENGVAATVRRALLTDREVPLPPAAAREVYRGLPDVARPDEAALDVAHALLGDRGAALTCVVALGSAGDLATEGLGRVGLTPRADRVRAELRSVFGRQSLGGFAPGGVTTGHVAGSAHYEGRALDVFFRPVTEERTRRGWQVALWSVAHAERLDVATVIFDRQIWSAHRSLLGWRDYRYPGGDTDNPVLLHEDHVHVDVQRGGSG